MKSSHQEGTLSVPIPFVCDCWLWWKWIMNGFYLLTGLWQDQLSAIYLTNPHGLMLRIVLGQCHY